MSNNKVPQYTTPNEAQALARLLQVAGSNTGQSATVANFLLSWWNAQSCGGWAPNDLWGLDRSLREDVLIVLGLIARRQIYPDTLGLAEEFAELVKRWRPHLAPPSVLDEMHKTDGRLYPARLVTYGSSPGYRDVHLHLALKDDEGKERDLEIMLNKDDAIDVMRHVLDVNRTAWTAGKPIDAKEDEQRPYWLSS